MGTITQPRRGGSPPRPEAEELGEPSVVPRAGAVWRARWWIWLVAALAALAANGLCTLIQPTYRSSSAVRLATPVVRGALAGEYARLVEGERVLGEAARRLRVPRDELDGGVSARAVDDAGVLRIAADGPSAAGSRQRADAVAASFVALLEADHARLERRSRRAAARALRPLDADIAALRRQLAASGTTGVAEIEARRALVGLLADRARRRARLVEVARPRAELLAPAMPGERTRPNTLLYTLGAALAAALGAALLASLLARPDRRAALAALRARRAQAR